MSSIPKISLGKQAKKISKIDLSHDVNTTANFGFCQPLTCMEMIPKQKNVVSVRSQVTLMPLIVPTGGRISYKIFHTFVPIHDLLESFDSLYANLPYNQTNGSYIPSSVPVVTPRFLVSILLNNACFDAYVKSQDGYTQISNGDGHIWDNLNPGAKDAINAYFGYNFANTWGQPLSCVNDRFKASVMGSDVYYISEKDSDFTIFVSNSGNEFMFRFHLTDSGKNLRKVFIGLGYGLDVTDNTTLLNALPIFAYYKAYFDIFATKREYTYQDTFAYSLLQRFASTGVYNIYEMFHSPVADQQEMRAYFIQLIISLMDCYYVEDNNFVSVHLNKPAISNATTITEGSGRSLSVGTLGFEQDNMPYNVNVTFNAFRDVLSMARLINISTALGKRLKEYWLMMTGSADIHLPESNYIGDSSMFLDISPLYATTEGENQLLGEMAGRSMNSQNSDTVDFTASTFGYWIAFGVIVPHGDFYQGHKPHLFHRTRFEFYNGMFDGIGMELSPNSIVMADRPDNVLSPFVSSNPFGFIPRYSGYKYMSSIVNGDMSLKSTRNSLLPYTLDKYITGSELRDGQVTLSGTAVKMPVAVAGFDLPQATSAWRYVNRYKFLSNYDRIFPNSVTEKVIDNNNSYTDDVAIINNLFSVTSYAPMLSIKHTFDTDSGGDDIEVTKA